jgi:hypothetical protein
MPTTPYERTQAVSGFLIPVTLNIGAPLLDLAAKCDVVTTCHEFDAASGSTNDAARCDCWGELQRRSGMTD